MHHVYSSLQYFNVTTTVVAFYFDFQMSSMCFRRDTIEHDQNNAGDISMIACGPFSSYSSFDTKLFV